MQPNPLLDKLGLAADARAVIFHADDVSMCHASLAAYADVIEFGLISSASVMVPCPWFPATAAFCREHAGEEVDMGVHLTLTSEWDGYRWGPLSTRDPASGLIDETGYFYASSEAVQEHGDPDAVQQEIEAQVERALDAGIDVTHVDTHMFSIVHQKFLGAYFHVARQHRIPLALLRPDESNLREMGINLEAARPLTRQIEAFEMQGMPVLDKVHMASLDQPDDRVEQVKQALEELPAGITYFLIHPAQDTPELRAIAPDWRCRVADYEAFTSKALRAYVRDSGIRVLGWRVLRDLMRAT